MSIRITCKQDGFRRCGVAHPRTPTEYPDGTFTKKQIEILKAEPMLVVEEIQKEQTPPPKKGNGKKGEEQKPVEQKPEEPVEKQQEEQQEQPAE